MKTKRIVILAGAILLVSALVLAVLLYTGTVQINHPSREKYPVRGVDVSAYQGEIDWGVLARQGIGFAYIKATEGSSMEDRRFRENWSDAGKTGLRIGAYHFFSFETGGQAQAQNFIDTVTAADGMLPPAVDVEPYGQFKDVTPAVLEELSVWLCAVEEQYGMKPVIYTTAAYYDAVNGAFPQYDIWIRSVYGTPPKDVCWTFWQYSNRRKLDGYAGDEQYIDMNVFAGTEEEFEQYGQ